MALVATILVISMLIAATSEMNLALGKPAYQSGQWSNYIPNKAVDGHLDTDLFGTYGCTHTESRDTPTPWWTVDLQGFYYISNVTITNRGGCCSERLNNFKVKVGNGFSSTNTGISDISTWPQCVHVSGQLGDGETRSIQCSEIHSGRFLSIYLDHDGILTLCEVQVFRYSDESSRVFQDEIGNRKVTGGEFGGMSAKTKSHCAFYCFHDNTCTQFSYHGDLLSNNCLLGSATSGEETQDGWVTILT